MSQLPRQAVVVVHGIGEQRPLATLRSFTRTKSQQTFAWQLGDWGRRNRNAGRRRCPPDFAGIVGPDNWIFGAPDNLRGRYDQRRLKVVWSHDVSMPSGEPFKSFCQRFDAVTDCFEIYWAYRFRDTARRHLTAWIGPVLLRRRDKLISPRLLGHDARKVASNRWLWRAAAASALLGTAWIPVSAWVPALACLLMGALVFRATGLGLISAMRTALATGTVFGAVLAIAAIRVYEANPTAPQNLLANSLLVTAVSTLAGLGSSVVTGALTRSVGDAARYLHVDPENVQETEHLREDAVQILEALHDAKDDATKRPAYDRIIVVGHSLGSVIAYDAIRFCWSRRHSKMPFHENTADDEIVCDAEAKGTELQVLQDNPSAPSSDRRQLWRESQWKLYTVLRDRPGVDGSTSGRWIISDFVTVGSPLSHADLLLAESHADFRQQCIERVQCTNPPVPQITTSGTRPYRYYLGAAGERPAATYLHQAAVFAAVRWTNLWHPHDIVGGPVGLHFGEGVLDIPLQESGRRLRFPRPDNVARFLLHYPHSSYWASPSRRNRDGAEQSITALRLLIVRPPTVHVVAPISLGADAARATLASALGAAAVDDHVEASLRDLRLEQAGQRDECSYPRASPARPSEPIGEQFKARKYRQVWTYAAEHPGRLVGDGRDGGLPDHYCGRDDMLGVLPSVADVRLYTRDVYGSRVAVWCDPSRVALPDRADSWTELLDSIGDHLAKGDGWVVSLRLTGRHDPDEEPAEETEEQEEAE